jgi:hypothetical protein
VAQGQRVHRLRRPQLTVKQAAFAVMFLFDADARLAPRTLEELLDRFAGSDVAIDVNHFPGLDFRRITAGTAASGPRPMPRRTTGGTYWWAATDGTRAAARAGSARPRRLPAPGER